MNQPGDVSKPQVVARAEWEARYREGRVGWDRGGPSPALIRWLEAGRIPEGQILVPGCGNGHEINDLVMAGRQVTAVDIAAQPITRLQARLHQLGLVAQVVQADVLRWQPAEPFDAIYEQTCLCALDPVNWFDYEQRLADWLRPGATLLALFMQTGGSGGPPYDCPLPEMRRLFGLARWQWPDEPPLEVPHPTGLTELGFVIRRR